MLAKELKMCSFIRGITTAGFLVFEILFYSFAKAEVGKDANLWLGWTNILKSVKIG